MKIVKGFGSIVRFVPVWLCLTGTAAAQDFFRDPLRSLAEVAAYSVERYCPCPLDKTRVGRFERCVERFKPYAIRQFSPAMSLIGTSRGQFSAMLQETMYYRVDACRNSVTHDVRSTNTNVVVPTSDGGTPAGDYQLTVSQVAKQKLLTLSSSLISYLSPSDPVYPGIVSENVEVVIGGGANRIAFNIPITASTTLTDLVNALNEGAQGRVAAFLTNFGSPEAPNNKIIMWATQTGAIQGNFDLNLSSGLLILGALDDRVVGSVAQDSLFTFNGVSAVSEETTILGLLPGLTILLRDVGRATIQVR